MRGDLELHLLESLRGAAAEPLTLQPDEEVQVQRDGLLDPDGALARGVVCEAICSDH
jgi:hypothetical protein